MKTNRSIVPAALAAAVFALAGTVSFAARADGLAARATDLAPAERAKLQASVAQAKAADPKAFAAVRNLKGFRPEHYRQFHNPIPQVGPELRHLGKAALLPMLEALVLDAPDVTGATEDEKRALIEGLVGEVGRLRDARASAALGAVFASAQPASVVRTAGRAMGRLCDAPSLGKLKASVKDGARRLAAIDGLSECRSLDAARALTAEIDATTSRDDAASLARALGNLGSSWAWQALGASREKEGNEVRHLIAASLVKSFGRFDGDTRSAHREALTMVEAAETSALVKVQRAALDDATAKDLDGVAKLVDTRRAK